MSLVEDFLTLEEEQDIVSAIRLAEKNTSGEIRVHIEASTNLPHFERALAIFHQLKMFNTKQQNAVLLYVAINDQKFVIYGDKGINDVVPKNFWNTTKEVIEEEFKKGQFKQGIIEGVLMAGQELKDHFPWHIDDVDELSNEVSKG